MTKKEIAEIRRILKKEISCVNRIAGCYVDANKEVKASFDTAFYSIPDELMFKYSDIFRKTLSGSPGKNLNTLEFSLDEELNGQKQNSLLELVKSELKDEAQRNAFFQNIIETYSYPENYLILLAYGVYDVPARSSDGAEMFDASDYVYQFVLCSICPVNLSKPGLCFDPDTSSFVGHLQDWMVEMPTTGFLYPAFNDRNKDIHSLLYFSKEAENQHLELTEKMLGCFSPVTAKEQKETFTAIVEEVFGKECDFETVKELHDNLNTIIEEKKENKDDPVIEKAEFKRLLAETGASTEGIKVLEEKFDVVPGRTEQIALTNLRTAGKFEVKTPDIKIQVSADSTDLLETMMIDGRECLVIPLSDDIEVNGIRIKPRLDSSKQG